MKMIAIPVVTLLSKVAGPEPPNRACDEAPPRDAPIPAPFPVWSKTIMIRRIQAITCMDNIRVVIFFYLSYLMI